MDEAPFNLPATGIATFGRTPLEPEFKPGEAQVAILGVPFDGGVGFRPGCRFGPRAIRTASTRYALKESGLWHLPSKRHRLLGIRVVDAGDVDVLPYDFAYTHTQIRDRVRGILERRAFPVILGGDHSISFPVVKAVGEAGQPPLTVLQVDAHLDFKDSVGGVKFANSCPMRRISELGSVHQVINVGLRGSRIALEDYRKAQEAGVTIIPAQQWREGPGRQALADLPLTETCYVTLDLDAFDPSIAPGVNSPEVDGLLYREVRELLQLVSRRTRVVGFDVVEMNPFFDPTGITGLLAADLIVEFLGDLFPAP